MGTYSFTKAAIQDLESICDAIAIDNPDAASNLFDDKLEYKHRSIRRALRCINPLEPSRASPIRGWVILSKDARIGKNQIERLSVADARVRMFTLASQSLSGTDMADIFLNAIPEMKKFIYKNPAPSTLQSLARR